MKNKKQIYDIVFVLDQSGSMGSLKEDAIGGFNSMLEQQKEEKLNDQVFVTTFLFNDTIKCLHERVELEQVSNLTNKDYKCFGNTALYDAIAEAINFIDEKHLDLARKGKRIANETLFVITTDGKENASIKHTPQSVKDLIDKRKKQNVDFLFLGANIDTDKYAKDLSIDKKADFTTTKQGVENLFVNINSEICMLRKIKR